MNYKLILFVLFGFVCLSSLEAQSESLQKTIKEKESPPAKSLSIKKPRPLPPGTHFKPKSPWPTFEEEDPAIVGSPFNTMPKPLPPGRDYEPTLPWPTAAGTFSITSNYFFENTAQVIAPHTNNACLPGRVVVSTGTPGGISYRNLYNKSGWYDANAITKTSSLPVTDQRLDISADNILLKLRDGSLMAIRLAATWVPVTNKPAWWDEISDIERRKPNPDIHLPNGSRGAAIVWRSVDCGTTWTRLSTIDPLNYENQRYAWPQVRDNKYGQYHWLGGWDRIEAYADPWTGYIYATVAAYAGPVVDYSTNKDIEPAAHSQFLFRSTDAGKTWVQIFKFDASTPIVISSTPNGRIYLYSVIDHQPTLFYSLLGSEPIQFSKPKKINYTVGQGGNQTKIKAGVDNIFHLRVKKYTNSISRVSTDASSSKVRLSYSWVDANGRTAVAVVKVVIPNDTAGPLVSPVATFHAANADYSILASTFIEPDVTGATVARTNTSILYWIEGKALLKKANTNPVKYYVDPTEEAYVRYSIFRGDTSLSQPGVLGGPYTPTKSVGHYMYGGSFFPNDGSYNYLAQWVQADGIRANIVTIPPYSPGVKLSRGGGPFSNVDFPGSDIEHSVMGPPPSGMLDLREGNCAAACGNNNDCVAWTYVRPNTIQGPKGNCWLKNNVPASVKNDCCVSGSVGEEGLDRPGNDYLHFDNIFGNEATPNLCQSVCYQQPKCKAWTFVKPKTIQGPKGVCWLKDAVPAPVKNNACMSGYFDVQVVK